MAQVLQAWLSGCRELLVRSVVGVSSPPVVSPVPAWMTVGEQSTPIAGNLQLPPLLPFEAPGGMLMTEGGEAGLAVSGPVVVLSDGVPKTASESKKSDGASDRVRLSDPLGAHLKPEVKEKGVEGEIC